MTGYKINSKISVVPLCRNDKLRKESEKHHPSQQSQLTIQILGVTLTKEVKNLVDKNLKSLKKESEEDTRK